MTKLEAFKEAARRDGDTPAEIERGFQNVILAGALPADAHDQITAGEEEAFISLHLAKKRRSDFLSKTFPPFNEKMESIARKRASKN